MPQLKFNFSNPDEKEFEAIDKYLGQCTSQLKIILSQQDFTWDTLIMPLEAMQQHLSQLWNPLYHLSMVCPDLLPQQKIAHYTEKVQNFRTTLYQNPSLVYALEMLEITQNNSLSEPQKKLIHDYLHQCFMHGAALNEPDQVEFKSLKNRLSQLGFAFRTNLSQATSNTCIHLTREKSLAGIPQDLLEIAKKEAETQDKSGWLFALTNHLYKGVLETATQATTRELFYKRFNQLASDVDEMGYNNNPIMVEMVTIRQRLAKLLGYPSFTDLSLASKMATQEDLQSFLQECSTLSAPLFAEHTKHLEAFALSELKIESMKPWDEFYCNNAYTKKHFQVDDQLIKSYFPLNTVLKGYFKLLNQLFGVSFVEKQAQTWDPSVLFFEVYDKQGLHRGDLYADFHSRPGKRPGAWNTNGQYRLVDGAHTTKPVVFLNTNFQEPSESKPCLLTPSNVTELFHEFGHALHILMSKSPYPSHCPLNGIPWDGIEIPSTMMEHWFWNEEVLALISGHFETQETLPLNLVQSLKLLNQFEGKADFISTLRKAQFDLMLHFHTGPLTYNALNTLYLDLRRTNNEQALRPANRFTHLFANEYNDHYAAGYYSYLWSEHYAICAFEQFEGPNDSKQGDRFLKTFLEAGGTKHFTDILKDFTKEKPSVLSLLQKNGFELPTVMYPSAVLHQFSRKSKSLEIKEEEPAQTQQEQVQLKKKI